MVSHRRNVVLHNHDVLGLNGYALLIRKDRLLPVQVYEILATLLRCDIIGVTVHIGQFLPEQDGYWVPRVQFGDEYGFVSLKVR